MNKHLPFINLDEDSLHLYLPPHIKLNSVFFDDMYYLKALINRKATMGLSKKLPGKDVELLEQIGVGGIQRERALNYLFEKHVNYVHRGINRYNLSEVESKEVFLDSLLALVSAVENKTFKGESRIATYLFKIFDNKAKNKIRDRMRLECKYTWIDELPIVPDKARTMLQEMVQEEEMDWVEKMLDQLGSKCRQILIMQEFQGYSMEEIAKAVGFKTARAVSTTRYRCLTKLKKILSKESTINLNQTQ